MLSPSDFNNAVPQFTNGNYASNPINPRYIAEPDAVSYNRGTEPLQTLPAQWWNWFLNKFTGRFNKVNVYVKNIFNELAQVLSIFEITPDGTEATPTTSQLKTVFECCYPEYVKTAANLVGAETTVNGHPLSSNVTVTRSDLGLGTSATVNTGTAAGCIPTVGTALGTTNNNILVTDASGNLKPSGITVGTAAGCDASAFRASNWTPTLVECAKKGLNGSSYATFGSNAFNSTAFTTCTGTVTQVKIGSTAYNPSSGVISLPAYPSTPLIVCCAKCNGSGVAFGSAATCAATAFRSCTWIPSCLENIPSTSQITTTNVTFTVGHSAYVGSAICAVCYTSRICGANGYYYGNICGNVCGCAYDSARLGGCSLASVRCGCWIGGSFGNVYWRRDLLTNIWTVWTGSADSNCNLFKAVCCATGNKLDANWYAIAGRICGNQDSIESSILKIVSSICYCIGNSGLSRYVYLQLDCTVQNICRGTRLMGIA